MLGGALPPLPSLVLALLYSIGAHGIMTLNDFKAIAGDRQMGINSIPVLLGPRWRGTRRLPHHGHATGRGDRAAAPLGPADRRLDRRRLARRTGPDDGLVSRQADRTRTLVYSGFGVPLYVLGMLASAVAVGSDPLIRAARGLLMRTNVALQTNAARQTSTATQTYDVVVVGGGPAGATLADDMARRGRSVLLLDKAGRIKPCGGAIPPRLVRDFAIPDST